MPGAPKTRAALKALAADFESPEKPLLSTIFEQYAELEPSPDRPGKPANLTEILWGLQITHLAWRKFFKLHPELEELWDEAKKARAANLAEDSLSVADDADDSEGAAVRKAALRVGVRHWLAARYDREQFGEQQKATLSIENLHLTAVQQINQADTERRMRVSGVEAALPALPPVEEADLDEPDAANARVEGAEAEP